MLSNVAKQFPRLYRLLLSSYSSTSLLFFGKDTISSEVGCHQGDPCSPLSFSTTIHPMVMKIGAELNSWYLDDGTIGDNPITVLNDFKMIIEEAKKMGLEINANKCELFFTSGIIDKSIADQFDKLSPGIQIITKDKFEILGVPIFEDGYTSAFGHKLETLKLLISRLEQVSSHVAYCL